MSEDVGDDLKVRNEDTDDTSDDDDSTDSEGDEVDKTSDNHSRKKRDIDWCDVDTETEGELSVPKPRTSNVSWPPSPQEYYQQTWKNLNQAPFGNPSTNPRFGNKMQLYCKTNFFLAVDPDGKIRGTQDVNDLHTHVELINAGYPGHLRIKGLLTNLYVCMNAKGRVYAEPDSSNENTIFIEGIKGLYLTYMSRQYAFKGWYLAIKKSGKMKNGKQTKRKQKAVQFIQRRKFFNKN